MREKTSAEGGHRPAPLKLLATKSAYESGPPSESAMKGRAAAGGGVTGAASAGPCPLLNTPSASPCRAMSARNALAALAWLGLGLELGSGLGSGLGLGLGLGLRLGLGLGLGLGIGIGIG